MSTSTPVRERLASHAELLRLAWQGTLGGLSATAVHLTGWLIPVGVGLWAFPGSVSWLRWNVARTRRTVARLDGLPAVEPSDTPITRPQTIGERGTLAITLLEEPSLWRNLWWGLAFPVAGVAMAMAPVCLIIYGIFGLFVQPFVWRPIDEAGGGYWYTAVHVDSPLTALVAAAVGAGLIAAGLLLPRPVLRLTCRFGRWLLGTPARTELERRVEHLTSTREAALDTQAAELRRIERDLHDGAQARLIAMGLNLAQADKALDEDPETARALMLEARRASSAALDELRDLVRGIHPPVLADRGIVDAVRALALDSAVDVEVTGTLPGRPSLPVESAGYFAISEVMTNAAKHAYPCHVTVTITHVDGTFRAAVVDDGPGGADPQRGTGLRGIERRLAAFDGSICVVSPAGGPTNVTMEIPCELS